MRLAFSLQKTFTLPVFNPASLIRSPGLRYLRTVIVTKELFSTALICFYFYEKEATGKKTVINPEVYDGVEPKS